MSSAAARRRLILAASLAVATLLPGLPPGSAEVTGAEVVHTDDRYSLFLEAHLAAPPMAVFAVITDYPHIQDLHRRVRESRILRRIDPNTAEVYTLLKGCVAAIFCKTIRRVELITENPPYELTAEVLPEESDLKSGLVHWQLMPDGQGTRLVYQSEMEPDFWVPPLLGDALMSRSIRNTTQEMIQRVETLALKQQAGGGDSRRPQP